jgi:catechol 2,3-dioxygenase-like lactoylglutathione lyase family enzyme
VNGEELDHLAFEVEDLVATVARLKQKGVEIAVEPYSIGGWKEAFAIDPNGIWIEFLEKKALPTVRPALRDSGWQ